MAKKLTRGFQPNRGHRLHFTLWIENQPNVPGIEALGSRAALHGVYKEAQRHCQSVQNSGFPPAIRSDKYGEPVVEA